jgi:hypothetical protein
MSPAQQINELRFSLESLIHQQYVDALAATDKAIECMNAVLGTSTRTEETLAYLKKAKLQLSIVVETTQPPEVVRVIEMRDAPLKITAK